jgi:serine/threonine protein kinase
VALAPGTRVGPYEIGPPLGAGGMGEVYRARDAKLGRDVALKVLPDSFARDPDRVARFKREAQVLAVLNHPHIAAIYGLESSGSAEYLVLELVEGETLADRLRSAASRRGAANGIAVEDALAIARQIADALEAAHEKGIIHRDLKPANIALTSRDEVKLLDFGLAKALDPGTSHDSGSALATESPTLTTPAMMTGIGTVLGTAAYMSPEQAKGRAADKRSDVWAFGCVLYEMLSGRRAFEGEDVADTLAAVLRTDPDFRLPFARWSSTACSATVAHASATWRPCATSSIGRERSTMRHEPRHRRVPRFRRGPPSPSRRAPRLLPPAPSGC